MLEREGKIEGKDKKGTKWENESWEASKEKLLNRTQNKHVKNRENTNKKMPVANFKTVKEKENKSELKCNMTKKEQ